MSDPTFRQKATGTGSGWITATFETPPEPGNLLVAIMTTGGTSAPTPTTTAWSLVDSECYLQDHLSVLINTSVWIAIVGTSTRPIPSFCTGAPEGKSSYGVLVVLEYENAKRVSSCAIVSGQRGPTVTPATGVDEVLVGAFSQLGPHSMTPTEGTPRASIETLWYSIGVADSVITTSTPQWPGAGGGGGTAAWGTSAAFFVSGNAAPNAPTGVTIASVISKTTINRLSWTFSDPDPGDSQSAYSVRYRPSGGTGTWTTHSATTPATNWTIPATTLTTGTWELQVRTSDALGAVGPWSASVFTSCVYAPTPPTITAPTGGAVVTATATVTWSVGSQAAYEVRRVADATGAPNTSVVYWDSGAVTSTSTRSLSVAFPTNSRYEHVQVRVKVSGAWSEWTDVRVHVSYTPPGTPTAALYVQEPWGAIRVAYTTPTPSGSEPTVSYVNIYRSVGSTGATEIRLATELPPRGTWVDYLPASGVDYVYRVEAVATNTTAASVSTPTVLDTTYDAYVASLEPQAWWKLTTGAGTSVAADSSGNGHTATAYGGVTFGKIGPIASNPSDGAVLLDGSTGYLGTAYRPGGFAAITIVAWCRPTSTTGTRTICGSGTLGSGGMSIKLQSGKPEVNLHNTAGAQANPEASGAVATSAWHLIVGTWNGTVAMLYVDGTQVATQSFTGTLSTPTHAWCIGQNPTQGQYIAGDVAQVAIFDKALTATEVAQLYVLGAAP